ncbi:MAG TPA: hypothetical protein VIR00_17650, partial [Micromonosporaceae bacterium]
AGLSSIRQPLAEVATECIRTLSLVLGDRAIAGTTNSGTKARPTDGRSHNTTYNSGGATAPNDPAARRVLLQPHLVVRDSG